MAGSAGFIRDMMGSLELNRALKKIRNHKMLNHGKMKYQKQAFIHGYEATEEELSALRIQLETEKRKANLKRIKAILIIIVISLIIFNLLYFNTDLKNEIPKA
jgi:hypothetical protein